MDNHIPLTDRKLRLAISRKRSVFCVLLRYIIRWISFHGRSNKFTLHITCADFLLYLTVPVSSAGISIWPRYVQNNLYRNQWKWVGVARLFVLSVCMYIRNAGENEAIRISTQELTRIHYLAPSSQQILCTWHMYANIIYTIGVSIYSGGFRETLYERTN